jgi:hypothetical protein
MSKYYVVTTVYKRKKTAGGGGLGCFIFLAILIYGLSSGNCKISIKKKRTSFNNIIKNNKGNSTWEAIGGTLFGIFCLSIIIACCVG